MVGGVVGGMGEEEGGAEKVRNANFSKIIVDDIFFIHF